MTNVRVAGHGGPDASLADRDLLGIAEEALSDVPAGARVLAIVADRTRDDNTPTLFPIVSQLLKARGAATLDALIAQGTHAPMSTAHKREKVGLDRGALPLVGDIHDHQWDNDRALVRLGQLDADTIGRLTGGLMREAVDIRANALLKSGVYDQVLIFGATMPHEVAGFAGGAKYFFPGVGGPELTHLTHWLGALATIEKVIGRVDTPTRRVIEAAADCVPVPVIAFTSVGIREGRTLHTRALFAGDLRESFRRAAAVSALVHIRYTGRKYARVIALLDSHYDELWVGGKASYKLGEVVEEGGELIIYAPHMTTISRTHGALIERYGYAPLDGVREMLAGSSELRGNLAVAAHLAHVSYASMGADPHWPRYRITLASGIDEATCRRVRLGYRDPAMFDPHAFAGDPDTLVVENAGRDLYLVAPR